MDRRFEVCEAEVGREFLLVPVLGERLPSLAIEAAREVARDGLLWGTYLDHFWLKTNLSVLRFVGGPHNRHCPGIQAARNFKHEIRLASQKACWEIDLPVACGIYFMEIFATLLAKIFLG